MDKFDFRKNAVYWGQLENGPKLVFHSTPLQKGCSILAWVPFGSAFENKDNEGIAHLLEHMIFRENKEDQPKKSLIDKIGERGGELNAFTSQDLTQFEMDTPKDYFNENFKSFLSLLLFPAFKKNSLKKEQKIILRECAADRDSPDLYLDEYAMKKSLPWAYGHSVGGRPKTVKAATTSQLKTLHQRFFQLQEMTFSIVGDLTLDQIKEVIRPFLATKSSPSIPTLSSETVPFTPGEYTLKKKNETAMVKLIYPGPSRLIKDLIPFWILEDILTSAFKGILFKKLRSDLGLVYDIYSRTSSFGPLGLFEIGFSCKKSQVKKIKKLIADELEQLPKSATFPQRFIQSQEAIALQADLALDSAIERNFSFGHDLFYYNQVKPHEYFLDEIKSFPLSSFKEFLKHERFRLCKEFVLV